MKKPHYQVKSVRYRKENLTCQHLDDNGLRCAAKPKWKVLIHENPEHEYAWYAVYLCKDHAGWRVECD